MVQSLQEDNELRLQVVFFRTECRYEPVREWLKSLPLNEKRIIGEDVKTVQFGWPLGMPVVRKNGTWIMGSSFETGGSDRSHPVHCAKWKDGFVARVYQEERENPTR